MSVTVRRNNLLACSLELPKHYRLDDILKFHGRDAFAIAESVDHHSLRKGLLWNNQAACLTIHFSENTANAELAIDGLVNTDDHCAFKNQIIRMLGLNQPIDDFEELYQRHPQLGLLIDNRPGLRIPVSASFFEALSWAIIGQQISVSAAIAIRRKLIQSADLCHSSGLFCYPNAHRLSEMSENDLRQAGFSQSKAQTLLTVSRMTVSGALALESWTDTPNIEDIHRQLQQIKGIGQWTINYALLRGLGWLDGSLHGDVAVRRGLQILLGSSSKINEMQCQQWLALFSPWRALVAAHLWAFIVRSG